MIITPKSELRAELDERLERTGGMDLLALLGEVSPTDRAHCERVGQTAMALVSKIYNQKILALQAGFAGSLHDVGKINPRVQAIVAPAKPLTPEQRAEVRDIHTRLGTSLIRRLEPAPEDVGLVNEAVIAAYYHHFSPRELIDLPDPTDVTRIVQIADQFDAMQDSARTYHYGRAMSPKEAAVSIRYNLNRANAMDGLSRLVLAHIDEYVAYGNFTEAIPEGSNLPTVTTTKLIATQ